MLARTLEPMQVNVSNGIGTIVTRGPIEGLAATTGRIDKFLPGRDLFNTDVTISGPINRMRINGSVARDSSINAVGNNGKIKYLQVNGDLIGDVNSTGRIGTIKVLGNIAGTITSSLGTDRRVSISNLQFAGVAPGEELIVNGYAGKDHVDRQPRRRPASR